FFFFSSRRRHTRFSRDWSSDVCSSDLFAFMRFIVFLVFLFSVQSFSQVKRINEKMSTDNAQKVQSRAVTSSLDRFSSVSLSDNRSEERRVGKECRSHSWGEDQITKRTW